MALLGTIKKQQMPEDQMYVSVGGKVIAHRGQATTTNCLGTLITNTVEGVMWQPVFLPLGVKMVDKDFIMHYLENKPNGQRISKVAKPTDVSIKIGKMAKGYRISRGVILVEHSAMGLKFSGSELSEKQFNLNHNPYIHLNEDETVRIDSLLKSPRGRDY